MGPNISFTSTRQAFWRQRWHREGNPRTTRVEEPSETKILVRHRLLHAILINLPHWYRRAWGSSCWHAIFVHSVFVFHRRDFSALQPRTPAEGRAEYLVTRSDLAEEFRDVDFLRSGIRYGGLTRGNWEMESRRD